MLQGEHSAILLTFIMLPFAIKTFVLSIFEWLFFTQVLLYMYYSRYFGVIGWSVIVAYPGHIYLFIVFPNNYMYCSLVS